MTRTRNRGTVAVVTALVIALSASINGQSRAPIHQAVLGEPGEATPEVSTAELIAILGDGSAKVFDARPYAEFAMSHIPGALNVAAKPGVAMSMYISDLAEIGRLVGGKKATPIVLYCNGSNCAKSKRLAGELLAAGYSNVRRYQLGIPVWRALGGICEMEVEAIRQVLAKDGTAVVIDAREAPEFKAGSIPGARNIPRSLVLEGKDVGEVKRAKDDGRLPMEDHNTRILVVGRDAADALFVAQALVREAFHNVSCFRGSVDSLRGALARQ
jgi:rhodanese-related sulfurtransferase